MQKAKPIEPGCKALVMPVDGMDLSEIAGQTVKVLSHIGRIERDLGPLFYLYIENGWRVKFQGKQHVCDQSALMRIDDPDEEETIFNAVDLRESIDE